ncbi:MAG: c-type cytochrome [Hyphomicrobium sp.]
MPGSTYRARALAGTLLATLASASSSFAEAADPAKPAATPPAGPTGNSATAPGGEEAFNNACRTCHSMKPGDNRLGPSLSGIAGKKAGASEGFAYSQSLKSSGVTWDTTTLDAFIANPDAVIAGNNMKPYTGISDAALRAKIIAYLEGAK